MRPRGITAVLAAVLVTLTVAQAPTAAAATVSTVAASVSTSKVTVGSSFALRAAVPRGRYLSTDVVVFQRKIGTSWRTVTSRTLGSDGRAAVAVTPTVGTRYYRVVKPATRRFTRAVSGTVKVVTVAAATEPAKPTIAVNGPGATMAVTTSAPVAKATMTVTAGQKVALAITDVSGFVFYGPPALSVLGPSGAAVELVGLSNTVPRSRWTFVAPTSGTYTVVLDSPEDEAGSVRVVGTTPLTQTFAVNGPSQVLSADLPGRELQAAFTATAGDYFSYDYDVAAGSRPNSVRLVDVESGDVVQGVGNYSSLGMWRIPESGAYRLELEPYTATTMSGTMFVSATASTPMAMNDPEVGATVSRPGAARVFTLPVEEGRDFTLGVTYDAEDGNDTNYQISVVSPGGVADVTVRAPHDTWTVKTWTGGTYLLIVRGWSGYTPSIGLNASTPLQKPVVLNGSDISVSTAGSPGRAIESEFTASAGDLISLAASNVVFGPTNPYGPRFLSVEMQDLATGEFVRSIDLKVGTRRWQAPHDGDFKLVYAPAAAYTMAFDLAVLRSAPVPIVVDGPPVSASIQRKGAAVAYSVKVKSGQRLVLAATPSDASHYNVTAFGAVPDTEIYTSGSKEIVAKWDGTMTIVVTGPTSGSGAAPLSVKLTTPSP